MNKAIADSAEVCKTTTKKFCKLISDTTTFIENFQATFDTNTTTANESLKSLGAFFSSEKAKLQDIRNGVKSYHEAFQTSIPSHIKIMDALTVKMKKVK